LYGGRALLSGYAIGLLLTIATAMLGFAFSLLKDKNFSLSCWEKFLFSSALLLLISSITLGLLCVINRLHDCRETTGIARDREQWRRGGLQAADIDSKLQLRRDHTERLGKRTWGLFWSQAATFGLGALTLVIALAFVYHATLF
jgi:hypothetical protein